VAVVWLRKWRIGSDGGWEGFSLEEEEEEVGV
jgi:hypothetical protein